VSMRIGMPEISVSADGGRIAVEPGTEVS
jgi:hypothetical protein